MENITVESIPQEDDFVTMDLSTATIQSSIESRIERLEKVVNTINICHTEVQKTGDRTNLPEFAHDTDVGLDMYPSSVTLESYTGNEYRFDISDDAAVTLELIKKAESEEKQKYSFFKRLKRFLTGKEWRLGWKRLKFDTGIAVAPDDFYFYYGAPNSRVVKTDVILQNSVGIIDPTYRGTIRFMYRNFENGFITETVKTLCNCCGQIFPTIRVKPSIKFVAKLSETERGTGGFGSSSK